MYWIQPWFEIIQSDGSQTQKTVMSDWNGERNVRGWLARTAVRHLESRTQREQNRRPELIQRCLALIWPFIDSKTQRLYKVWSRLLCNMWRLWLYKLNEVTGRRRRRARAEFEKARRPLFFYATWFEDDSFLYMFVCVCVSAMHKFLSWVLDCEWQLNHHDSSPCCRRFKAAQKIQAPVTQGWCMNSKGVQDNYILLSHFFWRPVSSDSSRMEQVKLT